MNPDDRSLATPAIIDRRLRYALWLRKSQRLDRFLTTAIEESKMSSKLVAFVEEVEAGTKELEATVDELRPRFQDAMQRGRDNMGRMKGHIDRVTKSIETVEQFNQRMSNMPPEESK